MYVCIETYKIYEFKSKKHISIYLDSKQNISIYIYRRRKKQGASENEAGKGREIARKKEKEREKERKREIERKRAIKSSSPQSPEMDLAQVD